MRHSSIQHLAVWWVGILAILAVMPTQAHGYIVRSIPEDRAVLDRAPTRVQYWFSEELEPVFSEITLLDANGVEIASGGVDEEDEALLVLRPPANLPNGAYVVSLRPAFASDGHVVGETRVFFVGETVAGVSGSAASDQAVRLEVVWRGIVLSTTTLLLGVTTLYNLVLRPAWGSRRFTAGFLPPRVMAHLTWIVGITWLVAVLGNVLALLQNASVLFNQDLLTILANGSWNTARVTSRFGDVWNVRMLLMLVFGAGLLLVVVWRKDKPRTVAPFWNALMWGSALIIGTFAVSSHASGSIVMPWVALLMHWLHMTAVAVWTGGLAALALVMPVALRPYTGEQRRLALTAVTRRFSRLAVGALLLTVTTGVYNSLNWLWEPNELTTTTYGVSLVYKLVLFGGLLVVAALHHIATRPAQYERLTAFASRLNWTWTLPTEMVVAFGVLLLAGFMSATPPPTPGFIGNDVPAPRAAQTENGLTVGVTLSPGGLGVNTYDARVLADGAPVENADVFVRMVRPSEDRRGVWHQAEPIEDGLYVAAGDEFDVEGEWMALVDVTHRDETTRFAYTWDITDDASVLETVPPRTQHWVALGAVILALGWVVYPSYTAFNERMNFSTLTSAIIVITTVATVVIVVVGFRYIGTLEAQNAALLNPPPRQVNPVLPDADSLARGAALYTENCGWDQDSRVFASLQERLPRTRDDELYLIVQEGWRELPLCGTSGEMTWDVVNYVRTFEPR